MTQIQLFAQRCSGSNFFEALLRKNCGEIQVRWEFGWKHFVPEKPVVHRDDLLYLVLYRNPFDWLRSVHGKPWHLAPHIKTLPFSDFIRSEWHCVYDRDSGVPESDPRYMTELLQDLNPETGRRFANALQMRTTKIKYWESIAGVTPRFHRVLYEELVRNPGRILAELETRFGIPVRKRVEVPKTYKGWTMRRYKWTLGLMGRYQKRKYPPICDNDRAFILKELDWKLEEQIGYKPDSPVE